MASRQLPRKPTEQEWDAAERRGSLFKHWVEPDYKIVGGVLQRRMEYEEEEFRVYFPMATPAIVGDFVRLRIGDTASLLTFARRWGLLGYDDFAWRDSASASLWARGDPVAWIWAHLAGIQTALSLWKFRRKKDLTALTQYLGRRTMPFSRWEALEPMNDLLQGRKFVDAQRVIETHFATAAGSASRSDAILIVFADEMRFWAGHYANPRSEDEAWAFVWRIVRKVINPNLRGVHSLISPFVEEHPEQPIVAQGWDSLMSVIYRHVFEIIASGEVEECRECGAPFVRTDGRQRFCPPTPSARESQCAMRFHKREQRRRQREKRGVAQSDVAT